MNAVDSIVPTRKNEILNTEDASTLAQLISTSPEFIISSSKTDLTFSVRRSNVMKEKSVSEIILIINDLNDEPAMYAVNYSEGGFAILSASTKESFILAFSNEGSFIPDSLSDGALDYLYERMEYIQEAKNNDSIQASEETIHEWMDLLTEDSLDEDSNSRSSHATVKNNLAKNILSKVATANTMISSSGRARTVGPLLKTAWSQFGVYNDYVENKNGCRDAPVGCVAVAGAQVVNYWKKGNYKWSSLNRYTHSYRYQSGAREVAKLMRDIGKDVGMNYGCIESSAYTRKLKNTFRRLGYRTYHAEIKNHGSNLNLKSWLDRRIPIIMDGFNKRRRRRFLGVKYRTSYTEGHAWVCDGYLTRSYTQVYPRTRRVIRTYSYFVILGFALRNIHQF